MAGCSLGMQYEPPQPSRLLVFRPAAATASLLGAAATASYLGPGERIATARSVLGNVTRMVDPYGEDQIVFQVTVDSATDSLLVVHPTRATLSVPHEVVAARTLHDYRKAWPTYPIADQDMAADQALAFAYILQTILLDQQVAQGDSASGRLAFPAPGGARGPASLALPITVGDATGSLDFAFTVAPPQDGRAR